MKRILCIFLCLTALFAVCSCSADNAASGRSVRMMMDTKPENIDPQLAETVEELAVVRNCFEGLFRYDNGSVLTAACKEYTVSDDGLEWNFTLCDGLNWSDGAAVTAQDFVFGIQRAITPDTVAREAELLSCIKGADAVLSGSAPAESAAVSAPDDTTVRIILSKRADNLPEILCRAICMPCRRDVFEKAAGKYGMGSELIVCNGPYSLASIGDSSVKLTANESYGGKFIRSYSSVSISCGSTDADRISNLSSQLADIAFISSPSADEADAAGLDVIMFKDTAWIIAVNPQAEVLGEKAVSAAIKSSLDSSAYSDALPFGFRAFGGVIADDLRAGNSKYSDLAGIRQPLSGSENAQENLIAALKSHKGKLEAINLIYPDGYDLKQTAARIAQYWQQQIGIVVNISSVSSSKLKSDVKSGSYQMALVPVSAEDGMVSSALSGIAELNLTQYAGEADPTQAEQKILSDGHVIPIAQSGRCIAVSSGSEGARFDLFEGAAALYTLP